MTPSLMYGKVPRPSEAHVPRKFRSTSKWRSGVTRIFSPRECLYFNDKWECLSKVADAGGPALVGGSSGPIVHAGATKGGKGEDTLRASAAGGFQFAMACFFFLFFWSLEEVVRWGEPSLKEEAWEVSTGWDSSVSLVMVNPFPARNHR